MNTILRSMAATAALALGVSTAHGAALSLSGNLRYHNEVVQFEFFLDAPGSNVRVWTDSWMSGQNFDPTAALWSRAGDDYTLLQAVDDDDTVAAGQGFYDVGFRLPTLVAGQYLLTLAAAPNDPNGALLSHGFAYDQLAPIPLAQWNQPSYDPNANDQKGGFYRVNFDNVDRVALVPEPAGWLSATLALALMATVRGTRRGRRRNPFRAAWSRAGSAPTERDVPAQEVGENGAGPLAEVALRRREHDR
jgi:hypothetical protein